MAIMYGNSGGANLTYSLLGRGIGSVIGYFAGNTKAGYELGKTSDMLAEPRYYSKMLKAHGEINPYSMYSEKELTSREEYGKTYTKPKDWSRYVTGALDSLVSSIDISSIFGGGEPKGELTPDPKTIPGEIVQRTPAISGDQIQTINEDRKPFDMTRLNIEPGIEFDYDKKSLKIPTVATKSKTNGRIFDMEFPDIELPKLDTNSLKMDIPKVSNWLDLDSESKTWNGLIKDTGNYFQSTLGKYFSFTK